MNINWNLVKYFTKKEFKHPDMLVPDLIFSVDSLRNFLGKPIIIHCDFEERATGGYHPLGMALDIHAEHTHWFDLFLAATRIKQLTGIGCYPKWNSPGIHIDIRPSHNAEMHGARWLCTAPGKYSALNMNNIKKYL